MSENDEKVDPAETGGVEEVKEVAAQSEPEPATEAKGVNGQSNGKSNGHGNGNGHVQFSAEVEEVEPSGNADLAAVELRALSADDEVKKISDPLTLTCKDVRYSVQLPKGGGTKTLLNGVSAVFPAGTVTAILGPSGSGKTVLLDSLSARLKVRGDFSGEITLNGEEFKRHHLKSVAYVHQHDILLPGLTVRESIDAHARLVSAPGTTDAEIKDTVDDVIEALLLEDCQNTLIGDEQVRGVSGGQKRRTAVAIELVTRPRVFFLDESTSGLDSYSALTLVTALRRLASRGHTIIMTLHQPRAEIYDLVDNLYVGGLVYGGSAKTVIDYFTKRGLKPAEFENTPDVVLDIVSDTGGLVKEDVDAKEAFDYDSHVRKLHSSYARSDERQKIAEAIAATVAQGHGKKSKYESDVARNSGFQQYRTLLKRFAVHAVRTPFDYILLFPPVFMMGLFAAILFSDTSESRKVTVSGMYLFFSIILGSAPIADTANFMLLHNHVYINEFVQAYLVLSRQFHSLPGSACVGGSVLDLCDVFCCGNEH